MVPFQSKSNIDKQQIVTKKVDKLNRKEDGMLKFIFCTDQHITNTQPRARVDNYYNTMLEKLRWVVDFANKEDAILLLGGDLVDNYNVSPRVITDIARVLTDSKHQIYSIIGNHDIYGHQWGVIDQVMLGPLYATGLIRLLTMSPQILTSRNSDVYVQLTGANYVPDFDTRKELYDVVKVPKADCALHLVHGFLVNKNWPLFDHSQYTTIQEVMTQADIICSGHEHHGYGIEVVGNKMFTNPGALGRVHASEGELLRKPQVSLIKCYKDHSDIFLIDVPAKSGTEVLSRTHILEEKAKNESLAIFSNSLQAQMLSCDVNAVFDVQAKLLNIEPGVRSKALDAYTVWDSRMVQE